MVSTNYFHYCPKALLLGFLLIIVAAVTASATGAGDERKLKANIAITQDVTLLNTRSYLNFLQGFRGQLAATYTRKIPILPTDSNNVTPQWADIVLRNGHSEITVRINRNNLYVHGYLMQQPRQWLELGRNGDQHMIQGADFLGFGGSYAEMEQLSANILKLTLNLEAFKNSVIQLATAKDQRIRARWLIILVQMISEGSRFIDIGQHFATTVDGKLPTWMRTLENDWAKYSLTVLRVDAFCETYKPVTINNQVKATVDDLRNILGIIHRDPVTLQPPCRMLPLQNVELDITSHAIPPT